MDVAATLPAKSEDFPLARDCEEVEVEPVRVIDDQEDSMTQLETEVRQQDDPADEMSFFAKGQMEMKYSWKDDDGNPVEDWFDIAERVTKHVMGALGYMPGDLEYDKVLALIRARKFMPGGRYLYASGRGLHQTQNCLLLKAEDSREGWADVMSKSGMALMTGAGIGIDYSDVRPSGEPIKKTGGEASGPISLMKIVNEIGRNVMQGGSRRSAIWAGLNWKHRDIGDFIRLKDWSPEDRARKAQDYNYPCVMDMTNISVLLDDEFFVAYEDSSHELHDLAHTVYWKVIEKMTVTGEPGFSIDVGKNAGETLRNACTEVTSFTDSDICNLGSINMGRIETIDEFREAVKYGTLFLIAGTVYSDVPYPQVAKVRRRNRRLGLGLMGVHEWLIQRGKPYGPDEELERWGREYEQADKYAEIWATKHDLSIPVKTRAIAPTGTIGIVAETSTGIEPLYAVAYKRRYKIAHTSGTDRTEYQYVVDPVAKRLVDRGVDPSTIEDAYQLSYDVERRVAFQAFMQQFVDHGISSTINLPCPLTDLRDQTEFGHMLFKYLPQLRGITCYPDGARDGQPLSVVPYHVAIEQEGVVFEEEQERCVGGVCGS